MPRRETEDEIPQSDKDEEIEEIEEKEREAQRIQQTVIFIVVVLSAESGEDRARGPGFRMGLRGQRFREKVEGKGQEGRTGDAAQGGRGLQRRRGEQS